MKNDQIQSIVAIPQIRQFLNRYHLTPSFVEENIIEFLTWKEEIVKCHGCRSLSFCRQRFKGKVYHLGFDDNGYLEERYISCSFEKEKETKLAHRKNFKLSHMSERDYLIELQNLTKNMDLKSEYLKTLQAVVQSEKDQKGLYLYGQAGVGKSYMMKALCNYYAKNGKSVCFVKVPSWVKTVKESFGDEEVSRRLSRALIRSDVVVFDDIGSESVSAWTLNELLFPILDQRMEQKKKTYFTSNYSMEELQQKYALIEKSDKVGAERIIERIRTLSKETLLSGSSLR